MLEIRVPTMFLDSNAFLNNSNMKRVVAIVMLIVSMGANAGGIDDLAIIPMLEQVDEPEGLHGMVIPAVVSLPKYSGSVTPEAAFVPLINVSYNDTLYFNVHRLGVWFPWRSKDKTVRAGLLVEQQRGFEASDGVLVTGLPEREPATEAGINIAWQSPIGYFDAAYLADVSDTHEGSAVKLLFTTTLTEVGKLHVKASGGYERMSKRAIGYYYGVKASEVTATRPLYEATDSTIHTYLALNARYQLNRSWSLNAHVGNNKMGEQIERSPIVDRTNVTVSWIGIGWHF